VTVLREGRVVTSGRKTQTLTQGDLVRLMVGRELTDVYALGSGMGSTGDVVLQVSHLACPPQVREGEIVSLAGLVGAGRSETLEAIFRLRRATGGEVKLHGQHFIPRTPREAILAGVGLIPEDRRRQGVVPDFSVRENLLLAHRGPGRVYAARREKIRALLALLDLPERRMLDANLLTFSGGMQQKIILARWLLLEPRLVLLDEPTRGVDIGTRASIYAFVTRPQVSHASSFPPRRHCSRPGFGAGGFPTLATTRIAHALPPRDGFATTTDGGLPTLLVPAAGRSGHSLGMVGLTLPSLPQDLDITQLRREIETALGDDTGIETQRVGTPHECHLAAGPIGRAPASLVSALADDPDRIADAAVGCPCRRRPRACVTLLLTRNNLYNLMDQSVVVGMVALSRRS
jgi:ABC-type branched-subunit amino acid transport system ATPase component